MLILLQLIPGLGDINKEGASYHQQQKQALKKHDMDELSSDEDEEGFYSPEKNDKMILTVQDKGVGIGRDD